MTIGKIPEKMEVKIKKEETLEQVTEFVYLGGLITEDAQCTKDIRRRISLASAMFGGLRKMRISNKLSIRTKKKLYETLVIPVLLYGSECWCPGLLIAVAPRYRYCIRATFTVAVAVAPLLLAESSGDSSAATFVAVFLALLATATFKKEN